MRRYGIEDLDRLVVVHDELDLPVGRLKVKLGGGLAGNNGLKSITEHLHTPGLRAGAGRDRQAARALAGRDHVLKRPGAAERTELDIVVREAADAVEMILTEGYEAAMGRFNAARE